MAASIKATPASAISPAPGEILKAQKTQLPATLPTRPNDVPPHPVAAAFHDIPSQHPCEHSHEHQHRDHDAIHDGSSFPELRSLNWALPVVRPAIAFTGAPYVSSRRASQRSP